MGVGSSYTHFWERGVSQGDAPSPPTHRPSSSPFSGRDSAPDRHREREADSRHRWYPSGEGTHVRQLRSVVGGRLFGARRWLLRHGRRLLCSLGNGGGVAGSARVGRAGRPPLTALRHPHAPGGPVLPLTALCRPSRTHRPPSWPLIQRPPSCPSQRSAIPLAPGSSVLPLTALPVLPLSAPPSPHTSGHLPSPHSRPSTALSTRHPHLTSHTPRGKSGNKLHWAVL